MDLNKKVADIPGFEMPSPRPVGVPRAALSHGSPSDLPFDPAPTWPSAPGTTFSREAWALAAVDLRYVGTPSLLYMEPLVVFRQT